MANSSGVPKRAWKLQEFVAHGASVNCVSLGHKSGRVLVTGGDDKKVNLWAVGKPNCIMSLCGHTTPIECVRFGQTEELVVAGSASGALKIWDLEAARLIRTLTGHKAGLTCADFHPYGDFLASGSADKNLKLWDIRRKGCIFTYKGHANRVNSLKFSPDGQWIASAGEDAAVKVWDLRAGKMMSEFSDHGGPVHDVEFHPHEFLLASASQDRTVSFWDLETFGKLSSSEKDTGPVRCLSFHPEGNVLFSGSHDSLKIHRWEPSVGTYDHISMGWGKIRDMAIAATQMIAVSYNNVNVSVYVVDLKRTQPFLGGCLSRPIDPTSSTGQSRTDQIPSSGSTKGLEDSVSPEPHLVTSSSLSHRAKPGQAMRKSFVKEKPGPNGQRPSPQVKISEEHTSSTDPEDSSGEINQADINDVHHYENIFRPRRQELNRTPEPKDEYEFELFQPPLSGSESDNNLSRPSDLRLRNVSTQGVKKPSPSPTRRISQPNPPAPGYGGSPVRTRRGSNPATPTGNIYKPLQEPSSSNSAVVLANPSDHGSGHPTMTEISVTPSRYPRPRLRHTHSHNIHNKKSNNHHYCYKRGDSLSLSRQRDYSSETELKIIEENIVSWGTVAAVQASMNDYRHSSIKGNYPYFDDENLGAEYRMFMHKKHCINDDVLLAHPIEGKNLIHTNDSIGINSLGCTQARQHRVSRYIQCLSQRHHGSLDRNFSGDISLLSLENENDNVFHSSLSSRLLLTLIQK